MSIQFAAYEQKHSGKIGNNKNNAIYHNYSMKTRQKSMRLWLKCLKLKMSLRLKLTTYDLLQYEKSSKYVDTLT